MKNRFGKFTLMLNLFLLLAGILFIVLYIVYDKGVFNLISIVAGITFMLAGGLSFATFLLGDRASENVKSRNWWNLVPILASVLLGIALVAANGFFAEFISYIFAVLLVIGSVYKFWFLFMFRKRMIFPKWFFIIPGIFLVCGVVLFAIGISELQKVLSLIVGIAFVSYAINSLFEYVAYKKSCVAEEESIGEFKVIE